MLNSFGLALKFLWREWRAGEWFIVFFALLLAITATTSIHFYTNRITRGLDEQATRFLGGDLVVLSSTPPPTAWFQEAHNLHLRTAEVWSYPSVVSAGDQLQLVNVQAVSDNYPLIGNTSLHVDQHTVWADPRLLPLLKINLNDNITIGSATFSIVRLLTPDLDTLNTGFTIAPRVMIRIDDVPATHTVIPGSRVDYRLLLAGDKAQIELFKQWIKPELSPSQRLIDVNTNDFALKNILQRTDSYLQLILLVCLMMSGVAIALSIQQYLRRHYSHVALWRCLGARQQQIKRIFIWQLLVMAIATGAIAIAVSYVAQGVFANLFKDYLQFPLPAPGAGPVVLGFFTSIFLLFVFAFPVINELPGTPPLFIWRNEIVRRSFRHWIYLFISWALALLFIYWFMNFSTLTSNFLGIAIVCIAYLYGLSLLVLWLLRRILGFTDGALRRGLSQLVQHPNSVSLQFIGFNLILICLIVLGLVRKDLLQHWQQSMPAYSPNYFAFNIAATDIDNLQQFFKQHDIAVEALYPMVRGRLIELNSKPILTAVPKSALNNNALHRDLNLSWMWHFPADNRIVSGAKWTRHDAGKPLVSVEQQLAKDLQLHLGDQLSFQIGDKKVKAIISNLRSVDWSSFHPNFFIIFPPGLLEGYSPTYITSFHLAHEQTILLNQLVQQFPNITVLDVASLLQQLQKLLGNVTLAMQYLFLYALGAGVLIFVTSVQSTMDERRQAYSLMRVLGAGKKYIRRSLFVEFGTLALLITGTSILLAYIIALFLEQYVYNL